MNDQFTQVRKAFAGLSESERLTEANKFIKHFTSRGMSVNQCIGFLQAAGVMSDTELMHATTF
tara:strand:+ start:596 stop:784 length:189 start_codon:yes stop_codon:yes gene_type:complete